RDSTSATAYGYASCTPTRSAVSSTSCGCRERMDLSPPATASASVGASQAGVGGMHGHTGQVGRVAVGVLGGVLVAVRVAVAINIGVRVAVATMMVAVLVAIV